MNIAVIALVSMTLAGLVAGSAEANLPSCSNCIESGDIAAGAVRASELNNDLDDSITANDIAAGGVASSEIKNGSVTSSDVASSIATQAELDDAIDFLFEGILISTGRIGSTGTILSSYGVLPFSSASYDSGLGRYELVVETDTPNLFSAVVTPNCSTAATWYATTEAVDADTGQVNVYLKDSAGDPEQCEFSILYA